MGRLEKIRILNSPLLEEMPEYRQQAEQFAEDLESQRRLLRSLMNVRYPGFPEAVLQSLTKSASVIQPFSMARISAFGLAPAAADQGK